MNNSKAVLAHLIRSKFVKLAQKDKGTANNVFAYINKGTRQYIHVVDFMEDERFVVYSCTPNGVIQWEVEVRYSIPEAMALSILDQAKVAAATH